MARGQRQWAGAHLLVERSNILGTCACPVPAAADLRAALAAPARLSGRAFVFRADSFRLELDAAAGAPPAGPSSSEDSASASDSSTSGSTPSPSSSLSLMTRLNFLVAFVAATLPAGADHGENVSSGHALVPRHPRGEHNQQSAGPVPKALPPYYHTNARRTWRLEQIWIEAHAL